MSKLLHGKMFKPSSTRGSLSNGRPRWFFLRAANGIAAHLSVLITILTSVDSLLAQAEVESVFPPNVSIRVLRLGQSVAEPARAGLRLLPGDLLIGTSGQVGVRCPAADGPVFIFSGGFRFMIDVPNDSGCTVDLLSGTLDVITDEPTEIHAGGITMGSQGTAYSATVQRDRNVGVSVFEGEVRVRSDQLALVTAEAGRTLLWNPDSVLATIGPNTTGTVQRAAQVMGAYDAVQAAGKTRGVLTESLLNEFESLYERVLSNAADTTSRIDLARTQAGYMLNDVAVYNLKKAAVTDTVEIRGYNIDPQRLRSGLSPKYEAYYESNLTTQYNRGSNDWAVMMNSLLPDLTVDASGPEEARAGQDIGSLLSLTVHNGGRRSASGTMSERNGGYMIDLVLSPDSQLNVGFSTYSSNYRDNVLLQGGRYSNTTDVAAGGSWSPERSSAMIPADTPVGRYCLGVIVDPGRAIGEANENNNTHCVWIRIVR